MPYQPRIGVVRDRQVVFRLAEFEVERVARAQAGKTRGDYIRGLIERDLRERGIE